MEKIKKLLIKVKDAKIFFLLASLFFGLEYYILGPFSYVQVADNLNSFVSHAFVSCRTLLAGGGFSYWMPNFSGGMDRLSAADSFSEIINWFFVLPPWLASSVIVVGGVFLSGYFTFLLCHEILGLGKKSSLAAGFIFSIFFIGAQINVSAGISILPFILFYLEKVFFSRKLSPFKKIISFIVLGVIYSFFSSLIFTIIFTAAAIPLWFFVVRKQRSPYFFLLLLIFFLPAAVLKIQEAQALMINVALSQRGAGASYWKISLKYYLNDLNNQRLGYFPGISIAPVIAFFGLWIARKSRLFWQMFVATFVLFFAMPLDTPFAASSFGVILGPFRFFDLSRFSLLIPFTSAITAACVFDSLASYRAYLSSVEKNKDFSFNPQKSVIIGCLIIVLLSSLMIKEKHFNLWMRTGSYQANTQSADLAWLVDREKGAQPFRVATMSLKAVKTLDPSLPGYYLLESADSRTNIITRRQQVFFKLMAKDGRITDSLYFLWNLGSKDADNLRKDFDPAKALVMPLLSLANTKYVITDSLINSPDLKLLPTPSAANWRSWESLSEVQKIKFKLGENFTSRKLLIYENQKYFPRFFLVKKVKSYSTEESLLEALATSSEKVLRENIFLEEKDAAKVSALSGVLEKIEVLEYSADKIKLKVESDGPSVLVVTNNYTPYWEALVNGQKTQIIPADYAYMGIPLTDKLSEVDLIYNPAYKLDLDK